MKIAQGMATLILGALPLLAVSSCEITESVSQAPNSAYLTFAGDTKGLVLQIDDGDPISLQASRREVRYSIPSGKHRVRVMRDKFLVVDRQIFVGRGEGFLIELP
jgi:hypothetical protein